MRKIVAVAPFTARVSLVGGVLPAALKDLVVAPTATPAACIPRGVSALAVFVAICVMPAALFAQGTPSSRPTDIDPAVNTSSPEQAPARETPRPQDINPGVNTSSPSQTPEPARSSTSPPSSAPSAAAPANAAGSASSPGAPAARSSAGAKPAGSATAPGNASSTTGAAAQNNPATGKPKGKALDRLELDTTQITGNRELPKVLYIVPWKRSDLGDLVGKPVNSLLDEVLTPVDRDVFKRENRYYRALSTDQGGNTTAPAAGNAAPASTSGGSGAPASRDER